MPSMTRRGPAGWRIAAVAAAGGVGALALFNYLSDTSRGEPRSALEGEQRRYAWTHGDIVYVVKGRGEPLVLVHGVYAGASSFEYRRVFERLATRYRVYAFDLLGFGLSDRPPVVYTPELYITLIADFARQVVGASDHPVRVVASALGAAFVIRAAAERPQLYERLVLIEPTGLENLAGNKDTRARRAGRRLLRTPLLGQAIYNVLASRPNIRYFLHATYGKGHPISDDIVDAHYTMAHQPGARFAAAGFVSGTLDTPVQAAYAQLRLPLLLIWGKNTRFTPLGRARAFHQANPRADLRVFDCGALPQEERPDEFVHQVGGWLQAGRQTRSR